MARRTNQQTDDTPAAPTSVTPAAEARAEVDRLWQTERRLSRELLEHTEALADLEARSGARMLDQVLAGPADGDLPDPGSDGIRARALLAELEGAISEARARRECAIEAVWRAEAADLDPQAAALRSEADKHQARTLRLLGELVDHEGVEFVPAPPETGERVMLQDGTWATVGPSAPAKTSRTDQLLAEAAAVEARAAALRTRKVDRNLVVTVDGTASDLLAAVEDQADPMAVIAPLTSIDRWARDHQAAQEARRADIARRSDPEDLRLLVPVRFELVVIAGEIEETASRAYLPPFDEPQAFHEVNQATEVAWAAMEDPHLVRMADGTFSRVSSGELARARLAGEVVDVDGVSTWVPPDQRDPAKAAERIAAEQAAALAAAERATAALETRG